MSNRNNSSCKYFDRNKLLLNLISAMIESREVSLLFWLVLFTQNFFFLITFLAINFFICLIWITVKGSVPIFSLRVWTNTPLPWRKWKNGARRRGSRSSAWPSATMKDRYCGSLPPSQTCEQFLRPSETRSQCPTCPRLPRWPRRKSEGIYWSGPRCVGWVDRSRPYCSTSVMEGCTCVEQASEREAKK